MSSKRKRKEESIPESEHFYFFSGHFRAGWGFRAKIRVGLGGDVREGMVWELIQSMKFLRGTQQEYKCVLFVNQSTEQNHCCVSTDSSH